MFLALGVSLQTAETGLFEEAIEAAILQFGVRRSIVALGVI